MTKYFINPSISVIPQMDFDLKPSENGGAEATQSFLVRKAAVGTSVLSMFTPGTRYETLDPNVPTIYRNMTLKDASVADFAPGWCMVKATLTGVTFSGNDEGGAATGSIPTYSLSGQLEDGPLSTTKAWTNLSAGAKERLGWLMSASAGTVFSQTDGKYGSMYDEDGGDGYFIPKETASPSKWAVPTGDELLFAIMISEGRVTCKRPTWTYTIRNESEAGFTSAQLNNLGKITASPPGNPQKPSSGYTWLNIAPNQEQSGDKRFFLDNAFLLIPDTAENQMIYGT